MNTKNTRILGIDFGSKRVGVAVSDPAQQFALPVSVVANTPDLLAEIWKIALDNEAKTIIIGESRNYAGEPNAIFPAVEAFKKELEKKGFTVYLELEFMTSHQAARTAHELGGKQVNKDASAAAIILQSYLDRQAQEI